MIRVWLSGLQFEDVGGTMGSMLIVDNFKLPIDTGEFESIYLVSGMCFADKVQYIYRVTQSKGYSETEEKYCQICGEKLLCYGDKSYISCDYSEVVACLLEQNEYLYLVVSESYSMITDYLQQILQKQDFSAWFQEIRILQSGNLSHQSAKKLSIKKLLSGTLLQKYSTKKIENSTLSKNCLSEKQKLPENLLQNEKKNTKDLKKNTLQKWRNQIKSSAQELLKKLQSAEQDAALESQLKRSKNSQLLMLGDSTREYKNLPMSYYDNIRRLQEGKHLLKRFSSPKQTKPLKVSEAAKKDSSILLKDAHSPPVELKRKSSNKTGMER